METIKVNGREEPLLRFSHTTQGTLPSGVPVKVDVYKFRNEEKTMTRLGSARYVRSDRIYLD